jgi:tetratricopeptide (TPR) repeat protein
MKHFNIKDFHKAIQSFDRALKMFPSYCVAWNSKGLSHVNLGEIEEGLTSYE